MAYDEKGYRHAIEARVSSLMAVGPCTLLVLGCAGSGVELLFHACPETGAVLTAEQATELAQALT